MFRILPLLFASLLTGSGSVCAQTTSAVGASAVPQQSRQLVAAPQQTHAPAPIAPAGGGGGGQQSVVQPIANSFVSPGLQSWGVQFLIPGLYRFTVVSPVTGNPERFLLQIPDIPPLQEAPLLVGFHAFGHSEDDLVQNTTFFAEAENRDWYMMAPLGLHDVDFNPATDTWKNNFGSPESQENTRAALNWVVDNFAIQGDRIYGVGFSMGAGGMASYAARHLDPAEPMFAAIVNHTGGVSLRDTYVESPLTRPILEFIYGDTPSNAQFEYRQTSTIEIVAGAITLSNSNMARNLSHIPINTTYAQLKGPSTQYLSTQSELFFDHLVSAVGHQNATETSIPGGLLAHTWGTLDETVACDFLAQFTLTIPDSSELLVDRDGVFFHFDVTQAAAGAFTPIDWEVITAGNQLDVFAGSNLDKIAADTLGMGLDPTQDLVVRVRSSDSSEHDLVLLGYEEAPVRIEFDGFRVCRVLPGDMTGWSYDPTEQAITLPRGLLTWGNATHQWDIRNVDVSPSLSTVVVTPGTDVVANGSDSANIQITVRDTNGLPVCGFEVVVSSDDPNDIITQPTGPTTAAGIASATIASTGSGLKTITVEFLKDPLTVTLDDHPTVNFIGDVTTPSGAQSSGVASPAVGVVADGVATSAVTLTVADVNGNPIPGQTVSMASDGLNNTIVQPVGPTDINGETVAFISSTTAELKTLTFTIDPGGLDLEVDDNPTVRFIGDASVMDASLSSAVASATLGVAADGIETSTITVTVLDVSLNAVPGRTIQVLSDGSNNLISAPSGLTDLAGQATVTIASTHAELKTLTVTVDPGGAALVLNDQPTVEFIPDVSGLSAVLSIASATPSTGVVADDQTTALISIQIFDSNSNPVPGLALEVASDGVNDTLQQPSATDPLGMATATIRSSTAELKTLTVTVAPLGAALVLATQPTVQFIGDAANISSSLSTVSASPATLVVANGSASSLVTYRIKDVNGNDVPGVSVEISSDGTGNLLSQPVGPTDALGGGSASIATTQPELKTITVTADPLGAVVALNQQATVLFDPDVDASLSTAVAVPAIDVVAAGVETSLITVTVLDSSGAPMVGQTVQVASDGVNNTISQPVATTDALGQATATIASISAELKTITATINPGGTPVVLAAQPTVQFIGDASNISAALSGAVALPAVDVVANGLDATAVTVTVRDINNNPIPGVTVELASTGTNNVITQRAGTTTAAGEAVAMVASTKAELKTFTLTADPNGAAVVLTSQPTAQFIGDAQNVSAALSTMMASPTVDVVANGVDASAVTVVLKDINNNLVPYATVALSADGTGSVYTQPPSGTDAGGFAVAFLASTTAEQKTITITVEPSGSTVILPSHPTVDFIPDSSSVSASLSTASATPDEDIIANGVFSSLITITIRDVNGNPIPNIDVDVSSDGTGNTITQPGAPTNAAGQTTASMVTTVPELKTLSFNADPLGQNVVLDAHTTIAFIPNISPSLSNVVVSPAVDVIADGAQTSLLSITIIDSFGAPALGQTVTVTSSGSGNTIVQPAGATNALGQTTATIASTIAEVKTLTFVVNGLDTDLELDTHPTATFIGDPGNISASLSTIDVTPAFGALANGADTITGLVTARDANGNVVEGQTVLLLAGGVGNTLVQPLALTDANGEASGTLSSVTAEEKILTARINPGPQGIALTSLPIVEFTWPLAGARYVRTGGSDSASGNSPASAWATLTKAAQTATAGQTVYVGSGTYQESVTLSTNGTLLSPIRFIADRMGGLTSDAGEVVVDPAGAAFGFSIDADFIEIKGFTVTGAGPGASAGGGVLVSAGAQGAVVRDCQLYGNERGVHCDSASDVTIESNVISNNFAGDGTGIWIDGASDVHVINNLIYNQSGVGAVISGGATLIEVHSCTYFANGSDQVFVTGAGTSAELKHCVFADGLADGIEVSGGATVISSYNLMWNHVGQNWLGMSMGTGDSIGDPLFTNPFGGDFMLGGSSASDDAFQLTPGSPAIDGGASSADQILLFSGSTMAEAATRLDGVLDGTSPDGGSLNLGFHYAAVTEPLEVLEASDGRLFYGRSTELQLGARAWDESADSWAPAKTTIPTRRRVRWVVNQVSPLANNEELLAVLCDTGTAADLEILTWTGEEWHKDLSLLGVPAADDRNYDLAMEQDSAHAMLVYSNGSSTPLFRTREAGTWSAPASVPLNDGAGPDPDLNNGVVEWVQMAARPNSDEITLFYTDSEENLVAIVWDGGLWRTLTAENLDTNVKINSSSGATENRAFDAAYEDSGDLVVAWARQAVNGFFWSLKPVNTAQWTAPALQSIVMKPHFIDLACEPGGDRIACGLYDLGDTVERMAVSMWNGTTWVNSGELDSQTWDVNDMSLGDFQGGVGWVGTSGIAVCVYSDELPGTLDWARWTAGTGWILQRACRSKRCCLRSIRSRSGCPSGRGGRRLKRGASCRAWAPLTFEKFCGY